MISVCMATYNGEKYIKEQINSIICQLGEEDELIISDDHSTDRTAEIVQSFSDSRIVFITNEGRHGVSGNFENSLKHSKGDVIFFSDQDDVWFPNKIKEMTKYLHEGNYDLVTCNCAMTDEKLNILRPEYYTTVSPIDRSVIKNWIIDYWLGACCAFTKETKNEVLPFPPKIAAHDIWICYYSQINLKCGYYPKVLQYFRRHEGTASGAGSKSKNSIWYRIEYRLYTAWHLIFRTLKKKIRK